MKKQAFKPSQWIDSIGGQSLDNLPESIFSNLLDNLHKDSTLLIALEMDLFTLLLN